MWKLHATHYTQSSDADVIAKNINVYDKTLEVQIFITAYATPFEL